MNVQKHIKKLTGLSLTIAAAAILWLALSADGDAPVAMAQISDTPTPEATPQQGDGFGIENLPLIEGKVDPLAYPNMDSNLNRMVHQVETGLLTAKEAASNATLHREESVAVTLYITEGYADYVVAFLEDSGASPRNVGSDYVEAYIPVSLLAEASQQEGVISIQTIIPPQPAQGVSQSAAAHGATAWHDAGFKGGGVKIGIIDDGFKGFTTLQGSELPSTVEALCFTEIGVSALNFRNCDNSGASNHGTAVAEALFDIAPEATYYLSNPISTGDVRSAVNWMIERDVDVINMSLNWVWSGYGDGTSRFSSSTLKSVDAAVGGGAIWINSGGNDGMTTWFGNFNDPDNDDFHNFTTNDQCNTFEVETSTPSIRAQLRWDDSWGGSNEDLDLVLYRVFPSAETVLRILPSLAGGADLQNGLSSHIPYEWVSYITLSAGTYCLAVANSSDDPPGWIQLQVWSPRNLEHYTPTHSISEPADSANRGLLAVGATAIYNIYTIRGYSSRGPTIDNRTKPDIVGVDGAQSAAFGGTFTGTSQAAPHVAGLAALVKQRFPEYTPRRIATYLKNHARERGGAGADNTWGHGFAHVLASDVATPTPSPTPVIVVTPTPITVTPPAVTPTPTTVTPPAVTPTPITVTPPAVTPTPTAITPPLTTPEILNRLSAIETLLATLQEFISTLEDKITALESRVAALEMDASRPVPTPTTAPITPTPTTVPITPTPTTVPGTPTPIPTVDITPSDTPIAVADVCRLAQPERAALPLTVDGSWRTDCAYSLDSSEIEKLTGRFVADGRRYYKSVSFDALSARGAWTATAVSDTDTFMLLWEWDAINERWIFLDANDDIESGITNSKIEWTPVEGRSYGIEITTYEANALGDFTLTISGDVN